MASIQERPDGRLRARYRDVAGREHAKHFDLKREARAWLAEMGVEFDSLGRRPVSDPGSRAAADQRVPLGPLREPKPYVPPVKVRKPRSSKAQKKRSRDLAAARNIGTHTESDWLALKLRYRNRCAYCGRRRSLTKDHIVPISTPGSSDAIENLRPACRPCNSRKSVRHMDPVHGPDVPRMKETP